METCAFEEAHMSNLFSRIKEELIKVKAHANSSGVMVGGGGKSM